jgi:hypothetical protein
VPIRSIARIDAIKLGTISLYSMNNIPAQAGRSKLKDRISAFEREL